MAENFERTAIHLESFPIEQNLTLENDLKVPLFNLKILTQNISEFDIRCMFWDQIINIIILRSLNFEIPSFYYRPSSEWKTESIFPDFKNRRVDFVIMIKIAFAHFAHEAGLHVRNGQRRINFGGLSISCFLHSLKP